MAKKKAKKKVAKKAVTPVPGMGKYGVALAKAGFTHAAEVVATNADVLEGKVKGWDRGTASDAKHAAYMLLNPQGAPPPGSYPNDGD